MATRKELRQAWIILGIVVLVIVIGGVILKASADNHADTTAKENAAKVATKARAARTATCLKTVEARSVFRSVIEITVTDPAQQKDLLSQVPPLRCNHNGVPVEVRQ